MSAIAISRQPPGRGITHAPLFVATWTVNLDSGAAATLAFRLRQGSVEFPHVVVGDREQTGGKKWHDRSKAL